MASGFEESIGKGSTPENYLRWSIPSHRGFTKISEVFNSRLFGQYFRLSPQPFLGSSIVLMNHYKMDICKNYPRGVITKKLNVNTKEPTDRGGPRRVSEEEIRDVFRRGWKINYIKEARIETKFHEEGGKALLSSITVG